MRTRTPISDICLPLASRESTDTLDAEDWRGGGRHTW